MTTRQHWTTWALVLGCSGALQLPAALSSAAAAQPGAPAAATRAKNLEARNLARLAAGARLEVQAPGKPALAEDSVASNALLRDDDPLGYELRGGSTSLLVTLPKVEVLNRFNFLNLTASGQVTVAISSSKLPLDSPRWRAIQTQDFSGDNNVVTCDLGSVEAKYVRVSFAVPAEGRIDTFGLYGQRTLGDTFGARGLAAKSAASDDRYVMVNYAADSPRAGVVVISPGEDIGQAQQMADGDVGTSYEFKASDPAPLAVIDLGATRSLTRVGATFKAGPGRLAIYLVKDPERRDGSAAAEGKKPGIRKIEDVITTDFPGDLAPVLAVDTGTQPGLNRVGANVDGQSGRYLVMMFHPARPLDATGGGGGDFKDFKDSNESADFKDVDGGKSASEAPAGNNEPLQIAEITGSGDVPAGGGNLTNGNPLTPPVVPGGTGAAGGGGGAGGTGGTSAPGAPPIAPPGSGVVTP